MINKRGSLIGKLWSRALHLFFRVSRGLTIGVRAVVRSQDGKFLLVRHTYTPGWHFPGGGVEPGETIEQALMKELQEEVGLELNGKPRLHGIFFNEATSKRDHVLVYLCETDHEISATPLSREIADLAFFDLEDLPVDVDEGTQKRLIEISTGQPADKYW